MMTRVQKTHNDLDRIPQESHFYRSKNSRVKIIKDSRTLKEAGSPIGFVTRPNRL